MTTTALALPGQMKIARLNAKTSARKIASTERAELYRALSSVLTNPAFTVLIGVLLTEYFQGHDEYWYNERGQLQKRRVPGGGFVGTTAGTALETSLGAYLLMQSSDKIVAAIGDIAKAIAPLIPAIVK